jgi:hypothetical protein
VALGERAVAARLGRALGRGESDGTAVAAARMPALTLAASVRTTRNEGKRRSLVRPKRLLQGIFTQHQHRVTLNAHTFTLIG